MSSVGASETRPVSSPVGPLDAGAFAPGTMLSDRYRIVALAGTGGMGEVYRAEDLRLGQTVALKFLPAGLEHDPAARERLVAEVRSARTVSHPNVCRVYDVGEVQGRSFLTMEYIDGEDLRSLLRRIGRLPPDKAVEVARQLCAGLAAAHDRGVLHRDLKPANVMIDGHGKARITDFGLAVEVGPAASPADFAGTVAYMAPERFRGRPASVQSDLYSLGLILYEAFTGKAPFKATTIGDWQHAHTDSTPTSPSALVPDMPPAVERAILRCLEKDSSQRPASAAQVAAALPGGDPLAAAVAAGETPSLELVAASGEEGTLPRWQAWSALVASAVGFAILLLFIPGWSLSSRVTPLHPELQKERARQILRDVGWGGTVADDAWWMRPNLDYLRHFRSVTAGGRALDAAVSDPAALLFCYRQGPVSLSNLSGRVSADDPAPTEPGDAYLELAADGRLLELRVIPSRDDPPSTTPDPFDWTPLLAAARVEPERLTAVAPARGSVYASDSRAAWEGVLGSERVRVEAAARRGRATYLRVAPTWMAPREEQRVVVPRAVAFQAWFNTILTLGGLVFLGVLAVRNLRLGRGDRRGAFRISVFISATAALGIALSRHWTLVSATPDPLPVTGAANPMQQLVATIGSGLFLALATWLAYVGFEPHVRRRWPHLLIASTRLLDGRWRDPLVGRSLFAGILGGMATILFMLALGRVVQLLGGGTVVPTVATGALNGLPSFAGFVALTFAVYLFVGLLYLAVLLLARLVLQNTVAAWIGLAAVLFVMYAAWSRVFIGPYPAIIAIFAAGLTAGSVIVLWRSGLLALAVWFLAIPLLRDTPWTPVLTGWAAWPMWFTTFVMAALAFWGFRNVLGRQSAFPAES